MDYLNVVMTMANIPETLEHQLPDGFSVRPFSGDRETWVAVQNAAHRQPDFQLELFDKEFGHDLSAMPERSYFLVSPDGRDIGTITAWYDRNYAGRQWGRLHWLAIAREFQGKDLAKPFIAFCIERMKQLGHSRVLLTTQTNKTVAIKCYLDLGFVPDMTTPDARRAWSIIAESVSHPVLDEALAS